MPLTSSQDIQPFVPVPQESLPRDLALPLAVFKKTEEGFEQVSAKGELLLLGKLTPSGPDTLYIQPDAWQGFLQLLEGARLSEPITPETAGLHVRYLITSYSHSLELSPNDPKGPTLKKIRDLSVRLCALLEKWPALPAKLLRASHDAQLYMHDHVFNAAVFSNLLARKFELVKNEAHLLTYAVLVHNVGNIRVPREILFKEGKLTPEERVQVQTHPMHGAQILQETQQPEPVVLTALQHHERMDGSGYPNGLAGEQIHLFARICSIADVFCALTRERPQRRALSPDEALEEMARMKGHFDHKLLPFMRAPK